MAVHEKPVCGWGGVGQRENGKHVALGDGWGWGCSGEWLEELDCEDPGNHASVWC